MSRPLGFLRAGAEVAIAGGLLLLALPSALVLLLFLRVFGVPVDPALPRLTQACPASAPTLRIDVDVLPSHGMTPLAMTRFCHGEASLRSEALGGRDRSYRIPGHRPSPTPRLRYLPHAATAAYPPGAGGLLQEPIS